MHRRSLRSGGSLAPGHHLHAKCGVHHAMTYHAVYAEEESRDSKPLGYSDGFLGKVPDMLIINALHCTELILTSVDVDHLGWE